MLRYISDLRLHPGQRMLQNGLPVVLSSDDPGIWGARPGLWLPVQWVPLPPLLGPPVVFFSPLFFGEASPIKRHYRKRGTLILTSLLEDLESLIVQECQHQKAWLSFDALL